MKPLKDSGENNAHNPIIQLMLLLIYLFSISEIFSDLQNKTVPLTHRRITFILSVLILNSLKSNVKTSSGPLKALAAYVFAVHSNKLEHNNRECSLCLVKQINFLQLAFVTLAETPSVLVTFG